MFGQNEIEIENVPVSVAHQFQAIAQYKVLGFWGGLLGGFPVTMTALTAFLWMPAMPNLKWLVYGGLIYSSFTICKAMMRMQKGHAIVRFLKAFGFTLILEGVMVTVPNVWARIAVVLVSVVINALENGYNMVCDHITAENAKAENVKAAQADRQAAIDEAVRLAKESMQAEFDAAKLAEQAKRDAIKAKRAESRAKASAEAKPTKRRKTTAQRKSAETGSPVLVEATNLLEIPEGAENIVAEAIEAAA